MARSMLLNFENDEMDKAISQFASEDHVSKQHWVRQAIQARIDARGKAVSVLNPNTYYFKMKDGTLRKEQGATPGAAWMSMGFKLEDLDRFMIAWKIEKDAKEAGWLSDKAPAPPAAPDDDLPFSL